jgi:serine/threonine-protein kinase LegK1
MDSRRENPSVEESATLRLDVKKVLQGGGSQLEKEILRKLLLNNELNHKEKRAQERKEEKRKAQEKKSQEKQLKQEKKNLGEKTEEKKSRESKVEQPKIDNKAKKDAVTTFQCFRDCYVVDTFPDVGHPENDKYKNSYILLRNEKDSGLEISLHFINHDGVHTELPISEAQLTVFKSNPYLVRNIPVNTSLYAKGKDGEFTIKNANARSFLTEAITTVPNHTFTQSGKEYVVEHEGKKYNVQLMQNVLRRESKKHDLITRKHKIRYEAYEAESFYSVRGKAALYNTFGVIKPNGKAITLKNKDARVVKVEPSEGQFAARAHHYKYMTKWLHLGHKNPAEGFIQGDFHTSTVMQKVRGESIENIIKHNPDYSRKNALEIMVASSQAYKEQIEYKGIVHCDIKPGNIMLKVADASERTQHLAAIIIDLEDAKLISSPVGREGTPGYLAPELRDKLAEETNMTRASDIYALGLTYISVVTGTIVTRYDDLPKILDEIQKTHGQETHDMLKSMIADDPNARPSITTVISTFKQIQKNQVQTVIANPVMEISSKNTPAAPRIANITIAPPRSKSLGNIAGLLRTGNSAATATIPFAIENAKFAALT